jgi:uncharacterized RDD family membrane protein YckC
MEMSLKKSLLLEKKSDALLSARFLSRVVDFSCALAIFCLGANIHFFIGLILSTLFSCFHEGILGGKSLGKYLFDLKTLDSSTGKGCSLVQSAIRNAFQTFFIFAFSVTYFNFILGFIAVSYVGFEILLLFLLPSQLRSGEIISGTFVKNEKLTHKVDSQSIP